MKVSLMHEMTIPLGRFVPSTAKGMVVSMKHSIPVRCLIDRSWNPRTKEWEGRTIGGTLIEFIAQSAEDNFGRLITVGVVILESGAIESVPVEFITITPTTIN